MYVFFFIINLCYFLSFSIISSFYSLPSSPLYPSFPSSQLSIPSPPSQITSHHLPSLSLSFPSSPLILPLPFTPHLPLAFISPQRVATITLLPTITAAQNCFIAMIDPLVFFLLTRRAEGRWAGLWAVFGICGRGEMRRGRDSLECYHGFRWRRGEEEWAGSGCCGKG